MNHTDRYSFRSFDRFFIGGEWVNPSSQRRIEIISPATEQVIGSVPEGTTDDIDRAVEAARASFDSGVWASASPKERAAALRRVADEVESRVAELAYMFAAEVGTPIEASVMVSGVAPMMWRSAADHVEEMSFHADRNWGSGQGVLQHEPVGVVGAIVPWNAPVNNASLKLSAALAAGCSVVLKPAWEGPAATFVLAEAIEAAGLPAGVVNIVPGGREAGAHLVRHPGVDKVTFTGSTEAGRSVMADCAARIARVTLELGGKSAAIVTEDVVIEDIAPALVMGGVFHSGQVCSAITRLLLPKSRYAEMTQVIAEQMKRLTVGDPFAGGKDLGPLVAKRQQDRVLEYIEIGKAEGAKVACGGGRTKSEATGFFVDPTLLVDVDNTMRVAREEIFGPVIVAIPYDDLDDAVQIANDSDFGLSGAVFAKDTETAAEIAARLRTGQVFLNSTGICLFAPFGGFKQSGLGREGGPEGISAFLETRLLVG